jgi:phage gpG-like protein
VPVDFYFVTQGERHAASVIESMGVQAANLRPALEEIYLTALDIIDETFDKEGERGGFPHWEMVAWQTSQEKARKGQDPRILRATGLLHESMTQYRHPLQYSRIERYKIVLSSRLVRGVVHQRGSATVPARPYVRFTETDAAAFAREILRHITKRLRTTA